MHGEYPESGEEETNVFKNFLCIYISVYIKVASDSDRFQSFIFNECSDFFYLNVFIIFCRHDKWLCMLDKRGIFV